MQSVPARGDFIGGAWRTGVATGVLEKRAPGDLDAPADESKDLRVQAIDLPKQRRRIDYAGATVLTPNRAELARIVGRWSDEADLEARAQALRERLRQLLPTPRRHRCHRLRRQVQLTITPPGAHEGGIGLRYGGVVRLGLGLGLDLGAVAHTSTVGRVRASPASRNRWVRR